MKKGSKELQFCCENFFKQLYYLESILKLTKSSCEEKEFSSNYYDLEYKNKSILSEERNNYINMLSIALDKVENMKEINLDFENEITYLR